MFLLISLQSKFSGFFKAPTLLLLLLQVLLVKFMFLLICSGSRTGYCCSWVSQSGKRESELYNMVMDFKGPPLFLKQIV